MSSGKYHSPAKNVKFLNAGDHDPLQCNHKVNGKLIHYKPTRATEGKEVVKVYDNDGTRELIVPNRKPTELPGILPRSELQRLKNQAHVITYKDRMAMLEEAERKKIQLEEVSQKRKELLQNAQLTNKPKQTSKLSEVETEAARKNLYMLQRAYDLREEQEDEMKKANSLILASKCLAIREAQLVEKELIKKELEEEERRLDIMMEQQRQKSLQDEENRKKHEEEKTQRYVQEVTQQIKENEVQKLVDAERIEEESRNVNRALIAMQREEEERMKQKKLEQLKMQNELHQANLDMERYKLLQKEEQRIADLRIKEFMRKKMEREAVREAELNAEKAAKEREIARLRSQQEKAQDLQAKLDELNAQRMQEEVERVWREKEKAAAKKRKDAAEEIRKERAKQIEDIRRAQAIEIARDEREFHMVAKVQNEQFQKDMEKKAGKKEAAERHRKELLKQINEKERERIQQHHEKFEEGSALRMEEHLRHLRIQEGLRKKIDKLRENNVPENYIHDIERQLKMK